MITDYRQKKSDRIEKICRKKRNTYSQYQIEKREKPIAIISFFVEKYHKVNN